MPRGCHFAGGGRTRLGALGARAGLPPSRRPAEQAELTQGAHRAPNARCSAFFFFFFCGRINSQDRRSVKAKLILCAKHLSLSGTRSTCSF